MTLPPAIGMYTPLEEHDACGLGFVAELAAGGSRRVVELGLQILARLAHRGAVGSDPGSGDGAGILLHLPDALLRDAVRDAMGELPPRGDYGVAMCFLSTDPRRKAEQLRILEDAVAHHGQVLLGVRDVPVDTRVLGPAARASCPAIKQIFIGRTAAPADFERTLFMIRKRAGRIADASDFYVASCSSKTTCGRG